MCRSNTSTHRKPPWATKSRVSPAVEVGADAADHAALRIGRVQGAAAGLQQAQVIRQRVAEFPRQGVVGIDRLVENLEVRHGPRPALPVMARHGGGIGAEVVQVAGA